MTTNDTLHRIRTALRLDEATMIAIYAGEDHAITAEHLRAITARPSSAGAQTCTYEELGVFLDGLIRHKRGAPTNPPADDADTELTHNLILKKLRVALSLKDPEVLIIFGLAEREISISQIKDLFRNPAHPRFRLCPDALLNDFLIGLDEFYYDRSEA